MQRAGVCVCYVPSVCSSPHHCTNIGEGGSTDLFSLLCKLISSPFCQVGFLLVYLAFEVNELPSMWVNCVALF